jgi:hypothetical protein
MIESRLIDRLAITNRKPGNTKDLAPQHQIEPPHCVVGTGFQSVRRAAAASVCTNNHSRQRRLKSPAGSRQQRGAGSLCLRPQKIAKSPLAPTSEDRRLTLHSSGAPTALRAGHQVQGLRPILHLLSSAQRRRAPLNSNVRHHKDSNGTRCALRQILPPIAYG